MEDSVLTQEELNEYFRLQKKMKDAMFRVARKIGEKDSLFNITDGFDLNQEKSKVYCIGACATIGEFDLVAVTYDDEKLNEYLSKREQDGW